MMAPTQQGALATVLLLAAMVAASAAQRPPPNYSPDALPDTGFSCAGRTAGGYYADVEAGCQMFHVCGAGGGPSFRFLCPNDTVFDQQHLICANWFQVNCELSTVKHSRNFELFKIDVAPDSAFTTIDENSLPELADYEDQSNVRAARFFSGTSRAPSTTRAPLTRAPTLRSFTRQFGQSLAASTSRPSVSSTTGSGRVRAVSQPGQSRSPATRRPARVTSPLSFLQSSAASTRRPVVATSQGGVGSRRLSTFAFRGTTQASVTRQPVRQNALVRDGDKKRPARPSSDRQFGSSPASGFFQDVRSSTAESQRGFTSTDSTLPRSFPTVSPGVSLSSIAALQPTTPIPPAEVRASSPRPSLPSARATLRPPVTSTFRSPFTVNRPAAPRVTFQNTTPRFSFPSDSTTQKVFATANRPASPSVALQLVSDRPVLANQVGISGGDSLSFFTTPRPVFSQTQRPVFPASQRPPVFVRFLASDSITEGPSGTAGTASSAAVNFFGANVLPGVTARVNAGRGQAPSTPSPLQLLRQPQNNQGSSLRPGNRNIAASTFRPSVRPSARAPATSPRAFSPSPSSSATTSETGQSTVRSRGRGFRGRGSSVGLPQTPARSPVAFPSPVPFRRPTAVAASSRAKASFAQNIFTGRINEIDPVTVTTSRPRAASRPRGRGSRKFDPHVPGGNLQQLQFWRDQVAREALREDLIKTGRQENSIGLDLVKPTPSIGGLRKTSQSVTEPGRVVGFRVGNQPEGAQGLQRLALGKRRKTSGSGERSIASNQGTSSQLIGVTGGTTGRTTTESSSQRELGGVRNRGISTSGRRIVRPGASSSTESSTRGTSAESALQSIAESQRTGGSAGGRNVPKAPSSPRPTVLGSGSSIVAQSSIGSVGSVFSVKKPERPRPSSGLRPAFSPTTRSLISFPSSSPPTLSFIAFPSSSAGRGSSSAVTEPTRSGSVPSGTTPTATTTPLVIRKKIRVRGRPSRRPSPIASPRGSARLRPSPPPPADSESATLPTNKEAPTGVDGLFVRRVKLPLSSALPAAALTSRLKEVSQRTAARTGRSQITRPRLTAGRVSAATTWSASADTTRSTVRPASRQRAKSEPEKAGAGEDSDYDYEYYDEDDDTAASPLIQENIVFLNSLRRNKST